MSKDPQVTRFDRAQVDEIVQALDGLSVAALNSPAEDTESSASYARAFTSAASAIRILSKQKGLTPAENEAYLATGYELSVNEESHEMRLSLYQGDPKNTRSFVVMDSPDVYEMAQRILKKYDILEGIR